MDRKEEYKIHYPNCPCSYYQKIMQGKKDKFLVSIYKNFKGGRRYYVYDNIEILQRNRKYFSENCLCTFNMKKLNGCSIIISNKKYEIETKETTEFSEINFELIETIENINDLSKITNNFYKFYGNKIKDKYVLIGKDRDKDSYSFPKGKIKYGETEEECIYRELLEETNLEINNSILNQSVQEFLREKNDCVDIPTEIILGNFFIKIIFID